MPHATESNALSRNATYSVATKPLDQHVGSPAETTKPARSRLGILRRELATMSAASPVHRALLIEPGSFSPRRTA